MIVIILNFERCGVTIKLCVQKMPLDIRANSIDSSSTLFRTQTLEVFPNSAKMLWVKKLDLHCLLRLVCMKNQDHYDNS